MRAHARDGVDTTTTSRQRTFKADWCYDKAHRLSAHRYQSCERNHRSAEQGRAVSHLDLDNVSHLPTTLLRVCAVILFVCIVIDIVMGGIMQLLFSTCLMAGKWCL